MENHHKHFISEFIIDKHQEWKLLGRGDFEDIFELEIPERAIELFNHVNLSYRFLTRRERDSQILKILKILDEPLVSSGPKRQEAWETGWEQNLQDYIDSNYDDETLIPYYYRRGRTVMRLWGDYILPQDSLFEAHFLSILQVIIAKTYFNDVPAIYEFGCGSGHNLLAFSRIVPGKVYHGLDWAKISAQILALADTRAVKADSANRFHGHFFDMFHPDFSFQVKANSAVFTFGAMEQLGTKFEVLFEYLYAQPASIYVHIEPFNEFRCGDLLLDVLADRYARKRNYLNGYLRHLEQQEAEGALEIIKKRKLLGSTFYDGWCLVVWRRKMHNYR